MFRKGTEMCGSAFHLELPSPADRNWSGGGSFLGRANGAGSHRRWPQTEHAMPPDVRKGMPARKLDRDTFRRRFLSRFSDPVFAPLQSELEAISAAAWDAYADGRKAPL